MPLHLQIHGKHGWIDYQRGVVTPFMLEIPNDLRHTRPFDLPAWQSIWKTFHFHSHSGLWLHQVQSDNGPMFDFMDTVLPSHYLSRY